MRGPSAWLRVAVLVPAGPGPVTGVLGKSCFDSARVLADHSGPTRWWTPLHSGSNRLRLTLHGDSRAGSYGGARLNRLSGSLPASRQHRQGVFSLAPPPPPRPRPPFRSACAGRYLHSAPHPQHSDPSWPAAKLSGMGQPCGSCGARRVTGQRCIQVRPSRLHLAPALIPHALALPLRHAVRKAIPGQNARHPCPAAGRSRSSVVPGCGQLRHSIAAASASSRAQAVSVGGTRAQRFFGDAPGVPAAGSVRSAACPARVSPWTLLSATAFALSALRPPLHTSAGKPGLSSLVAAAASTGDSISRWPTANPGVARDACRHSQKGVASPLVRGLPEIPVSARSLGCKYSPSATAD